MVGQAAVAVVPMSPLHATQVNVVLEQAGAAGALQSLPVRHVPQVPAPGPLVTQRGRAAVRQGAVAVELPKLPLHAVQTSVGPVVLHAEVTPVQPPCSVTLHGPQRFVRPSQTLDVGQSTSSTHPPH